MATQTITVTSFENVSATRLHFTSMQAYNNFGSVAVALNGENNLQWNFVGYNAGGSIVVDKYWYNSGVTVELLGETYIDQVTQWELWVRFSDNAGISPSDITSAVCDLITEDSGWYVGANGIDNTEFLPDVPYLEAPFPVSVWQCDIAVDRGFAHVPLFPDAVRIEPHAVQQTPYISVYDAHTDQAHLEIIQNNGLAILTPTVCDDHETLCGMWSLNLEHPIDNEGRYQFIHAGNLIRAGGQLFTIKSTYESWEGNSGKVSAYAEMIWYQLADEWLLFTPDNSVLMAAKKAQTALDRIMGACSSLVLIPGGVRYGFNWYAPEEMQYDPVWYALLNEGHTPVDMILGEGGLIAAKGGELHRDNFYFSICPRKETARDNAFDIRVGKNLTGIRRTVDTTSMCTVYQLTDSDTGAWCRVGWDTQQDFANIWGLFLPHHVVRSELISYPPDTDFRWEQLCQEMQARFARNCMPVICYEVSMEDVRKNPDFSMISDESIRVGDIGRIFDIRLGGTIMLEITETTYDRITGKLKSFTVGQKQSFVYHPNHPIVWDEDGNPFTPTVKAWSAWVRDSTGRYIYDATGRKWTIGVDENA